MQAILALLHTYPPLAYRQVNATTTRVVATINELGYVWVIALGTTALFLAMTQTFLQKARKYAHLLCGAVAAGYDIQLWVGALGETPFGPVAYPVSFVVIVVSHVMMFLHYDGGDR